MDNLSTTPRELPLLAGIASAIRWLEDVVSLLAGPLLTASLGIGLVAVLSDGALLVTLPFLIYVWAVSLAVGIDCQMISSFDRVAQAARAGRYWIAIAYLALGCVLAYVAWVSAYAFGVGQADHLNTAQALATLGMDNHTWLLQRFALQVGLVCLSGLTRYHAPPKVRLSVEQELAEIERKAKIAAANQRLNEVRALGVAHLGRSLMAAAKGEQIKEEETRPQTPPTGPGSPVVAPSETPDEQEESDDNGGVTALPARRPAPRRLAPAARKSTEEKQRLRAFSLLEADPEMSVNKLKNALNCRWGTADKLKRQFDREHSQRLAL